MESQYKPGIVFKFRRPRGSPKQNPSVALTEALQKLSESDEMREFVAQSHAKNRKVVLEVFHSAEGRPLLIHTAATPEQRRFLKLR
jgi:hypothetical protein